MIKARLRLYSGEGTKFEDLSVYNSAVLDLRIDEELDTASVQVINEKATPYTDMSIMLFLIMDDNSTIDDYFYAFDTVEKRGKNYYVHNLSLVEPTRLFMGIMIDGLCVTQPVDGSAKKSLYDVLRRLLKTYALIENDGDEIFKIYTDDEKILTILENTESPEFSWQAETLLWECLQDIGNVINAIPRLKKVIEGRNNILTMINYVTFDLVNETSGDELEL